MEIKTTSLESAPNDILIMIFSMLSVNDVRVLSVVCRRFYMITKNVWTNSTFDTFENRKHIANIYGKCVMTKETLISMGALLELNVVGDDKLGKEFYEITAPLLQNESVMAACNTFTLKELVALSKLYCSDIGSSITSKTNLYITTFQRNSSEKIMKVIQDFQEKHRHLNNANDNVIIDNVN